MPARTIRSTCTKKTSPVTLHDVAIVGGGPAGLSAALWLARFLHDIVVIDSGDPRNWQTRGIHGYLGHPNIKPAEFRALARQQCEQYAVPFINAHIQSAHRCAESEAFKLTYLQDNIIFARRVLLAIGLRDNWPEIPGLERCYGSTIHTCPFCDGYEARDSRIAVIGTGAKAASVAITLRAWSQTVFICTHGEPVDMTANQINELEELHVRIYKQPIHFLQARFRELHHITFTQADDIPCDHIFIALGQHPPGGLVSTLDCKCDETGRLIVDSSYQTTIPGVFAAGDITPGLQLAMRAANQGLDAAVAIHRSLQ